jgi:hypothetical protein
LPPSYIALMVGNGIAEAKGLSVAVSLGQNISIRLSLGLIGR